MRGYWIGAAMAVFLASCATSAPGAPPAAPPAKPGKADPGAAPVQPAPDNSLTPAKTGQFQAALEARYKASSPLDEAVADLRKSGFTCQSETDELAGGAGMTNCTYARVKDACADVWFVAFEGALGKKAKVGRPVARVDRRCMGALPAPPNN